MAGPVMLRCSSCCGNNSVINMQASAGAVTALGKGWAGDAQVFVLLREQLGDQYAGVRRAAVTALGKGWAAILRCSPAAGTTQ